MRIELIHPMLVHFPIALLSIGVVLRALAIFYRSHLLRTAWIVLGIGAACAWMAILAGEFAADVVGPNLCNHHVLYRHSTFAYRAAILFSGALILDWAKNYWPQFGQHKIFSILCFILYLAAGSTLLYVGFLGGSLVYEQGAAVEKCCKNL